MTKLEMQMNEACKEILAKDALTPGEMHFFKLGFLGGHKDASDYCQTMLDDLASKLQEITKLFEDIEL